MERGELKPSEVVSASLSNIAESDSQFHAWVVYGDGLIEQIRKEEETFGIEAGKLFEYIPIGVKDIYNTRDFPTQMGSPLWKDFTPGNDARSVFNLKREGAVVVGKTVTAEFAVHTLGKTLNPYDTSRTPGTSSSGSAVAVALGHVPLATGSQTAGSIVRPASFCGIYGMKPSFGTIPRTGTLKTTDSLDTLGFFVIHGSDLLRGFDSLRVRGKNYPISNSALSDPSRQKKEDGKPWRVRIARTHTWENAPAYAKEALESFVKKLALQTGIEISDIALPVGMERAHSIHETIYNKALSYYFKDEHKKSSFVSPIMNELIAAGNIIDIESYQQAIADQRSLIYAMDEYMQEVDVLISLSTAGEAPYRDVTELPDPALMWTLAHLPVVSVPQFRSPKGLPFGFQVVARKYNDYLLLEFLDYLRSQKIIPEKAGFYI